MGPGVTAPHQRAFDASERVIRREGTGTVGPGEFRGRIGRYHWESEPWWPSEPAPPPGAPNVLVVLLDDVGFAQFGCFGSDIATPTFDRLAAGGLR